MLFAPKNDGQIHDPKENFSNDNCLESCQNWTIECDAFKPHHFFPNMFIFVRITPNLQFLRQPGYRKRQSQTYIATQLINVGIDFHSPILVGSCFMAEREECWIVDSGAFMHICNTLRGFHQTRLRNEGEAHIHMESHANASVKAVDDVIVKLPA